MVEFDDLEDAMREELDGRAETLGRETAELWRDLANEHLLNATPPANASQDEWNMQPIADSATIRRRRTGGRFAEGWEVVWEMETPDGFNIPDAFEFGTDPHDIEGNPILHWEDPETGEDVFRHRVRHPGIPAVAFIRFGKRRIEIKLEEGDFSEGVE
jgi:hypothetical protein